jgi:hypothetical protein
VALKWGKMEKCKRMQGNKKSSKMKRENGGVRKEE